MWQLQRLKLADVTLGWEEAGTGEPLLFLAGGPGDTVDYLRPIAEPLTAHYRCVLLDQRGCGKSPLERLDEETLAMERLYDDIAAVREALGVEQITLIGHSWGAMLALYFALRYPQQVKRLVLIAMGPLDPEASAVGRANNLKPLTPTERTDVARHNAALQSAREQQDWERAKQHHIAGAKIQFRAWFFDPDIAARFSEAWEAGYAVNPVVHQVVNKLSKAVQPWGQLAKITAPTLVLYGYQDFGDITQGYRLKAEMPNVTVRLINQAGHMIWWEQPGWVESEIQSFLEVS